MAVRWCAPNKVKALALLAVFSSTCLAPVSAAELAVKTQGKAVVYGNSTDTSFVHKYLRPGEYMLETELKPGMDGYGLSVFHGTTVEKFPVKIIGVLKNVINGRNAILIRIATESMGKNNVIRGMSGSPIYVNNKLVGALSFGFDFSKEPIAGVTPIVDMLDSMAQLDLPEHLRKTHIGRIPLVPTAMNSETPDAIQPRGVSGGAPRMVPLMSPVALSGFSPQAESFLSERLGRFGLLVNSGSAGGLDPSLAQYAKTVPARKIASATPTSAIAPGGAISVLLSTGDFSSQATGTATQNFNGKILAFGHSFLSAGPVEFPMATAFVHEILPSLAVSFKLASPINVVGSMVSDRPWSVGGVTGRTSRMIPATFTVTDETRQLRRKYDCAIVDHPDLTPDLLSATAMSAVDATHQSTAPYIAKVNSTIEVEGHAAIHRSDRFSSNFSAHTFSASGLKFRSVLDPVGSSVLNSTNKIMNNTFESAKIKRVKLDIVLEDGRKTARVERVYLDKSVVAPGDNVTINCVVKPFNEPEKVMQLSLPVPRDIPDGDLLVGVTSGDDLDVVRKRLGIVDPIPDTLSETITRINTKGSANALCAVVALPDHSIHVGSMVLPGPPAHWNRLFFSDRYTRGPILVKGEERASADTDYLLDGSHIISVEVKSPDKELAKAAPFSGAISGSQAPLDGIFVTDQARKVLEAAKKIDTTLNTVAPAKPDTPLIPWFTPKEYPHSRLTQLWRQESESAFRQGKCEAVTLDSWGRLLPGFKKLEQSRLADDTRIWSSVYSEGYLYIAASDRILRWKPGMDKPELVVELGGIAIPSLVADSNGVVYAACVPSGRVVAISGNKGKFSQQVVFQCPDPVIASMEIDNNGTLYVGAAGSGKVYKVEKGHGGTMLVDSGQAHVTCLWFNQKEKKLYIGTGEKGCVFSVQPDGSLKTEYQSSEHIVTGIARDRSGSLYVATAGSGRLMRLNAKGEMQLLATSQAFYTLVYDEKDDCVYTGDAEGDITQARVEPLSGVPYLVPVFHTEQEAVTSVALNRPNGQLLATSANLPSVMAFEVETGLDTQPTYVSQIKDGERLTKWMHVRLFGLYNDTFNMLNKTVRVETRTGESSQPDSSWSAWKECPYTSDGFAIASPNGRYFQYRLSWNRKALSEKIDAASGAKSDADSGLGPDTRTAWEKSSCIHRLEVTYLGMNQTPKIASVLPISGTVLSGKHEFTVTASDPDHDNLDLRLDISTDRGSTWRALAANVRPKHSKKEDDKKQESTSDKDTDSGKKTDTKDGDAKASDSSTSSEEVKSNETKPPEPGDPTDKSQDGQDVPPDPDKIQSRSLNTMYANEGSAAFDYLESSPALRKKEKDGNKSKDDSKEDKKPEEKEKEQDKSKEEKKDDKTKDESKDQNGRKEEAKPQDKTKKPESKGETSKPDKTTDKNAEKTEKEAAAKNKLLQILSSTNTKTDGVPTSEKFTWTWDTSKQKDGAYLLRFIVTDQPSNGVDDAKTYSYKSIIVDNSKPTIGSVDCKEVDGKWVLRVVAEDSTQIANATFNVGTEEPWALVPIEGTLADSQKVVLGAEGFPVPKGTHKLEVQVWDRAGNSQTRTISVVSHTGRKAK